MDFFTTQSNLETIVTVTKDDFLHFHNIDRQLFSRFVVELDRDTSQSIYIMAFIMWVERKIKNLNIVHSLLKWPKTYLNNLADEVLAVLSCTESEYFPSFATNKNLLPHIQMIMGTKITLQYFHHNRMEIISGVAKILNDVCTRAFTDIVHQVQQVKAMKEQSYAATNYYEEVPYNPHSTQQAVYYAPTPAFGVTFVPPQIAVMVPQWNELGHYKSQHDDSQLETYDALGQQNFNEDIIEALSNLGFTKVHDDATAVTTDGDTGKGKGKEVTENERTIFLTFSDGYPISEIELRQYFTRKYGDVVESVIMQDVVPPAEPLFACLLILPEAKEVIDHFLTIAGRIKFTVNGKNAWARKYARRSQKEAWASSSS